MSCSTALVKAKRSCSFRAGTWAATLKINREIRGKCPSKTTIIVDTEVNLLDRPASEKPHKNVFDLHYFLCPNMFKVKLKNLLWTLEYIGEEPIQKRQAAGI